ncbi:MAG: glutamate 5-kinase [Solirubrobacterales bacterium]
MAVVLKIGSNVATDESGELREDVLGSITAQAAGLHKAGTDVVLVTSGAISRGTKLLGLPARPSAMAELQASSAVGQGQVYRRYDELLAAHGVRTAQILLTFGDMSARANYVNARRTLRKLLEWHVVPVINENDTTATDEISFGDNDFLAAQVAILVRAERLVLATDIDSLYTADPHKNPAAKPISRVDDFAQLDRLEIGDSASGIGSGGMRSKVAAAEIATAGGIPVVVCSGKKDGAVGRAAAGIETEGTHFTPHERPHSSFKLWLRYAKETRGTITIDQGAVRALREQGTSLLPVGIVGVSGEFFAGDAVEIASTANGAEPVGKGIVNYSAEELTRIKGMKSQQVQELMPRATDEAVHRDNLVLTRFR